MCELVQSFEQIKGNEAVKNCYLVSDIDVIKQFFKNTPSTYKQEITKDKKTILTFGNTLKVNINNIAPKDGKKEAFVENESGYMTVLFNFYDYLTVKPTKELSPEYRFQQILLPVEASYQFDNELKRYQKQQEFPNDSNVSNILNLIQKGNIEPQMKLENQDLIIEFQSNLERFNTIIFTDVLLKYKTQNESGFKILFHKAPYVPIFPRDDKKDIRYQINPKTYNINVHDKTDLMKINLSFQCVNKTDRVSRMPEPINQDEIKGCMQKFALIEAIRIMKQHAQAFKWLGQLKDASEQKVEKFYSENHPQLNNDNREQIEELYNISLNNKIGNYQFTEPSYRTQIQQIKNLAQYVMSQIIQKPVLKNSEELLINICKDKLHQKQYQCQVLTKFIGRQNDVQTNIVDFVDLINMFTVFHPKNKFVFNICPQFKFGRRTPTYTTKDPESGDIDKAKIQTMTMETRFIVKQILDEPKSMGGETISYNPGELLNLDDIENNLFEDDIV